MHDATRLRFYLFIFQFCDIVKLPIVTTRFNQFGYRPNVNVEK